MPARLPIRIGVENVVASDVKTNRTITEGGGIFAYCDVQVIVMSR